MKKLLLPLLFTALLISCKQDKPKQSGTNSTPIEYSENVTEEEFSEMTEEERAVYNDTEAPDEGLSQLVYDEEDLEMPGELIGKNEIILMKSQFSLSYNTTTYCPNYVCWRLYSNRTRGGEQRPDDFIPDISLTEPLQVNTHDYSGSGYDRGHMCPAGDNKNSHNAMMESFMMTNICPQNHDLNSGDWNELEELCREWADDYGDLYICCGPIFDSAHPKTIGKRGRDIRISVPDRFFKVVLLMGSKPRAIGFIFPNEGTRRDLRTYAVSVDRVERETGIDFYPSLPDNVENKVERECKPADWNL